MINIPAKNPLDRGQAGQVESFIARIYTASAENPDLKYEESV